MENSELIACQLLWKYGKALENAEHKYELCCQKLHEMKADKEIIYNWIAELYDYIQDADYVENEYILEQLANIQQYAK